MTKEIQQAVGKMLVLNGCEAVCENIDPLHMYEYDVAALSKSGLLHEYEVKISRSDFLADKKKRNKENFYSMKINHIKVVPNYFSYVVPEGLVSKEEIPVYAGLYYYKNGEISQIKMPKRIHADRHDVENIKQRMLRMISQRNYLGCTMLTYKNREAQKAFKEYEAERIERTQRFIDQHRKNNHE